MASNLKEFAQELKQRIGIEQVVADYVPSLKRMGRTLKGLCPFHQEKTPSFHVNTEFNRYHCFGCGAKGDAITFIQEFEKVDFVLAVETLARRFGITVPEFRGGFGGGDRDEAEKRRQALLGICKAARDFFRDQLGRPAGARAREYLAGRGLTPEQMREYDLGFAPDSYDAFLREAERRGHTAERVAEAGLAIRRDHGGFYDRFRNRIIFPITDHRGDVVAFGGRLMEGEGPKYLNSSDTPLFHKGKLLYGLTASREAIRDTGRVILLEGYMDWIAMHSHGIRSVLAGLGTAFGEEQARFVKRLIPKGEAVVCYDGDEAGRKAAFRATELLLAQEVPVRIVDLPEPHDPDSYIREFGVEAMTKLVEEAPSAPDFFIEAAAAAFPVFRPEGKTQAVEWLMPILTAMTNPVLHEAYVGRAASRIGVDVQAVKRLLGRRRGGVDGAAPGGGRGAEEGAAKAGGAPTAMGIEKRELYLIHRLLQHLTFWDAFARLSPELFSNPHLRNLFARIHGHARDLREGAMPLEDVFELCATGDEAEMLSRAMMIGDQIGGGRLNAGEAGASAERLLREVEEIRLFLFQRMTRRVRGELRSKLPSGPRGTDHDHGHAAIHSVAASVIRETREHFLGPEPEGEPEEG